MLLVTAAEDYGNALLAVNIALKRRLMRCILLAARGMALIIIIIHGRGPNNKMCTQLQPKKTKLMLY